MENIIKCHGDAKFYVKSGDLSEFAEKKAYQSLKKRLLEFQIPCFLITGNHDDRNLFQSVFNNNPYDENKFLQSSFETDEGVFIFLDTKNKVKMYMMESYVRTFWMGYFHSSRHIFIIYHRLSALSG